MSPYTRANLTAIAPAPSLTDLGIRLPVRVREGVLRTLVDADDDPFLIVLPPRSGGRDRAHAIAAAINNGCGVPEPAIDDCFDPHHGAAVEAESRQQAERMSRGRLLDAAE